MQRLLARGLLALALLFAQQYATLHWLGHAIEATHAKASGSAGVDHCDECVALAALGAAALGAAAALSPAAAPGPLPASLPAAAPRAALRLAFRSRAPPIPV